jgi:prophage regulatory protein
MPRRHVQNDCSGKHSLFRLPKVLDKTGLGKTRLYELMAEGSFPRPISIGLRSVAWPSEEVDRWVKARIKSSRRQQRQKVEEQAGEQAVTL